MSTAHRPTWAPAQAKDIGSGSRQLSVKDIAGHTKLKFRQPGQGTASEVARRDLKLELARAEEAARRKRKGLAPAEESESSAPAAAGLIEGAPVGATQQKEDEQAAKRRKMIEDAAALDRDDSDSEDDEDEIDLGGAPAAAQANGNGKGKGKAPAVEDGEREDDDDEEEDSEDEEEDDEDETAELLRELEKIKRERAEEKARQESDRAASAAVSAEESAASGNPLLNLQAALSGSRSFDSPGGYAASSTGSAASSFAIQKRWDDDVIFKNQAMKTDDALKEGFINDNIRSTFHRRFMAKYIA